MPIYDALVDRDIGLYHVRHEAAAVHMADAWGRLTGRPGVALVAAGPGFANTLSALYVAQMAESPLVLISGSSPAAEAGQRAFQEMPQSHIAEAVAKASWTVSSTTGLAGEVDRALRVAASGRPGPVHVTIPVDILEAQAAPSGHRSPGAASPEPQPALEDGVAARFFALLRGAPPPHHRRARSSKGGGSPGHRRACGRRQAYLRRTWKALAACPTPAWAHSQTCCQRLTSSCWSASGWTSC